MLNGQRSCGVRLRRRGAAVGLIAMVVPTDGHQLLSKRPNREEDFNGSFSVPDPTFASFFQYQLKRDAAKVDLSQNCLVWSTDTFVYTNDRKAKGGLDMGDEEEEGLNALLNQEPGYDDQTQHDWEVTAKIAAKNKEVSNNVDDAKCVDGSTELHEYQLISRDSFRDYYEKISEAVYREGGKAYRPMSTDGSQMVLKGYYVGGKVFGDLGYLARQKKEEEEEGQGSTETVEETVSAEEAGRTRDVGVQTEGGENVESDGEEATPTDGEILEAYDESFVQRSSDVLFTRNLKNSTALVTSPIFLQKAEQSFASIETDPNSRFETREEVVGEERREIDRNVVMKFFFGPNLGKVTQFTLPGSATASTRTIAAGINYVMGAFNSDAMGNPVPKRDGSVLLTVKGKLRTHRSTSGTIIGLLVFTVNCRVSTRPLCAHFLSPSPVAQSGQQKNSRCDTDVVTETNSCCILLLYEKRTLTNKVHLPKSKQNPTRRLARRLKPFLLVSSGCTIRGPG